MYWLVFCIVAFAAIVGAWWWLTAPIANQPMAATRFVIPKGQAISVIGSRLTEKGLIRNPLIFRLVVKITGAGSKLQAGSFEVSPNMGVFDIVATLTKGTDDVWITVVEGWRVEEIAEMLTRQELPNFDQEEFLGLARSKEGYLYPDSYLISRDADAEYIFNLLTNTFEKKVEQDLADEIAKNELSLPEIVTLASIVEREARGDAQMKMVAGILLNRLEIDMALQVDASLQYIKGYNKATQDWWSPPLAADKDLKSKYNTYLYPGLPPAPISNPGIGAIKAVLSPTSSNYVYYLHDMDGAIHYAATLDEHNANIAKYLR